MNKNNYRILTFSNGLFVPQDKVFFNLVWSNMGDQFSTIDEAKYFIKDKIAMRTRPTIVSVSYIED